MYIDANKLSDRIRDHQSAIQRWLAHRRKHPRSRKRKPQVPDALACDLLAIARGLTSRGDLAGHPLRDDLESAAVGHLLTAVEKFDDSRGPSAFSFLTRCAWFSICKSLRSDNRYRAMLQRVQRIASASGLLTHDGDDEPHSKSDYFPSQASMRSF
jgi:hypothetical protein